MTIRTYVRVSTDDQNLDRQLESTFDYAQRHFDVAPGDVRTYRDRSTGTNTDRSDYRRLMADVSDGDAVIVHSISRISRSIRDLDRTAERIVEDASAELHIVSEGFRLAPDESDPYQKAMFQLLGVFAELEAEMAQQRAREGIATRQSNPEYYHGPAPLGFEKDDGHLVEGNRHDRVVATLEMVQKGTLSKRKAAKELDTSRRTINRALQRPELYGLVAHRSMARNLDGATVTHARSDEIIVETAEGEGYRLYALGDAEPAGFSGALPPEGATITSVGSDHLTYKTLSGEKDSAGTGGGEEDTYIEIEQLDH